MTAKDLARIMMLATKGLKASTTSIAELRQMTDGLIAMAAPPPGAERHGWIENAVRSLAI